jgi:hypothetical protein
MELSGQFHAPAALRPVTSPRYPLYMRLGEPQSRAGRHGEVKIIYPTGTVVQPVASRYTDCAIVQSIKWVSLRDPFYYAVSVSAM